MKGYALVLVMLRGLALSMSIAGRSKLSDTMYALADLIEAGKATDDHMAMVAEKLKSRELNQDDFDDVIARIRSARAELHK